MSDVLFKHQQEGIDFLLEKKKAILADEMGLGKTRQAIMAAEGSTLIVCPASVKGAWEKEISTVYPDVLPFEDVITISGRKMDEDTASAIADGLPSWIIINYDILDSHVGWIIELMENEHGIKTLILDEAHYIKSEKAKRTKAALAIAAVAPRVYELTGTPVMNRPAELYTLLKAIGHPLGARGRKTYFMQRYCDAHLVRLANGAVFMQATGAKNLGDLRRQISGSFLRREKKDVLDLPEKIISVIEEEMKPDDRAKYDRAFDDYIAFLELNPPENLDNIILAKHLVELMKMKRICAHAKLPRIISDIEDIVEAGEKVVVFTQYNDIWEELVDAMNMRKIQWAGIRGETKSSERAEEVQEFQTNDECKVFVGNIDAAGIGITLTAASQVIFADLDWTPSTHQQAEDRCHRIGQAGTVNVRYYVLEDTIEEDILDMLAQKKTTIEKILAGREVDAGETSVAKELIRKVWTTR